MPRVLVAELKQETATFNPAVTRYSDFRILEGSALIAEYTSTRTAFIGTPSASAASS